MPVQFVLKDTLWSMKITQRDASKLTGVPENTLSRLCRGEVVRVPLDQINKICKGLSIPMEKVVSYAPDSSDT